MNKKISLGLFAITAILAVGCVSDSSSTSAESSVPAIIDQIAKTITIMEPSCKNVNGQAIFNPTGTTSIVYYELIGNQLKTIDEDEDTITYTGNNSSVFGYWTANTEWCAQEKMCTTIHLSTNSFSTSVKFLNICPISVYISKISKLFETDSENIKTSSCSKASLLYDGINWNFEVITFTDVKQEIKMSISGSSKSCSYFLEDREITESLCTIENIENEKINGCFYYNTNEEEFNQCFHELYQPQVASQKIKNFSKLFKIEK